MVKLHKTEYLARRVGETAAGFITGVTHFGLFVQLADVPVEGLVHVSTLGDDYYKHREDLRALVGANTGTTFRHGDAVTVKIAAVNTALRRADFVLVRERAAGAARRGGAGPRGPSARPARRGKAGDQAPRDATRQPGRRAAAEAEVPPGEAAEAARAARDEAASAAPGRCPVRRAVRSSAATGPFQRP